MPKKPTTPNAFTMKPDVSRLVALSEDHGKSRRASKAVSDAPGKFLFVIDARNPAHAPNPTAAEIADYKLHKKLKVNITG